MDATSEEELEAIQKQLELQLHQIQEALKKKRKEQTKYSSHEKEIDPRPGSSGPSSVLTNKVKQHGQDPSPRDSEESKPACSSIVQEGPPNPSQHSSFAQNRFQPYEKLRESSNRGKDFEIVMCGYYSLKLTTDKDVNDFEMTSNGVGNGKFDDIGLRITFTDGRSKRFLLQLKHKETKKVCFETPKSEEEKKKGKKGNKIEYISANIHLQSISKIKHKEDTDCIFLTNSPTDHKEKEKLTHDITIEQCNQLELPEFLIYTEDEKQPTAIFKIRSENLNRQFYFVPSQMNDQKTKEKINGILKNLLECEIGDVFVDYMRHWWAGNFFLTKHDVIAKISQLAFSRFLRTPSNEKSNEKTEILKEAVMNFQLTIVVGCDEDLIEHIWKFKNTSGDKELKNAKKKYGLKEHQVSTALWFLGQIPLIVKVDNENEGAIKRIIDLLGRDMGDKKIILTGRVPPNEFTQYSKLESLSDIIKKCGNEKYCLDMLQKFHISLQGRKSVTLEDLIKIDGDVSELIGTRELLRMSQKEHLLVGDPNEKLPDLHIARTISSVFIKIEDILNSFKASHDTLIILNVDETSSKNLLENREFNKMELSQYLNTSTNEEQTNLILLSTGSKCTNLQFESVCSESKKSNIHLLQQLDDGYCIPILREGEKLKLETTNSTKPVTEDIILENYNNPLHVICAPPGMGKSTLMQVLHNTCPPDHLAVYVSLINHNGFLSERPDLEAILARFLQIEGNENDFFKRMKQHFWQKRRLYMFLDGLDEVNSEHVECILNFVKHASSQGANIWLSSRENLREKICQTLHVVPVDIKELDEDDQKRYIHSKLERSYEDGQIEKITTAIFKSTDVSNSRNLLGIPLQLHIITDMFVHDTHAYDKLEEENVFVLTKMYRTFFERKIEVAFNKLIDKNQKLHLRRLTYLLKAYEIPALKICLDSEDYERLQMDKIEVEDFLEILKEKDEFGIVKTVTAEGQAIFVHQTYAEYFAAVFFKKNPNKLRLLADKIFERRYENFRKIFDIMLAENNPLHLAIIYEDHDRVEKLIEISSSSDENRTNLINSTDGGGRNAFHLAFSYGQIYPFSLHVTWKSFPDYHSSKHTPTILGRLLQGSAVPDQKDNLFDFDCVDYALKSTGLCYLIEILQNNLVTFEKLKKMLWNYDRRDLAYCCAQFGYPNLFCFLIERNLGFLDHKKYLSQLVPVYYDRRVLQLRKQQVDIVELLMKGYVFSDYDDWMTMKTAIQTLRQNVDFRNHFGEFPIHAAVKFGNYEILEALLSIGRLNVNVQDHRGITALHLACKRGSTKIVEDLLSKEADKDLTDNKKNNALHYASMSRYANKHVIGILINRGLSVDEQNEQGQTPLHLACQRSNIANVRILLEYRANPKLGDIRKYNALHYAFGQKENNQAIIELLIDNNIKIANEQNEKGQTPLHLACKEANDRNVAMLLKKLKQEDVKTKDNEGNNALHYASRQYKSNQDVIELLVDANMMILNEKNQNGQTPLHLACEGGNYRNVIMLLGKLKQEDVKTKDNEGNNALHYASRFVGNNQDVIELLVNANMMILNEKNQNGETPLHLAYKEGNYRNVEMLLKKLKPEDAKIKDNEGNNALHCASRHYKNNKDVIELLVDANMMILNEKNQNGQTPLHLACQRGNDRNVAMLLKKLKQEDVKTKDNEGNNALHYASRHYKNNQDVIELLVNANMMILNEKNQNGQTPLHLACKEGNHQTVEKLLKKLANFRIEDDEGNSALHYAAMSWDPNTLILLINKELGISKRNRNGQAPLHLASREGRFENVRLLLKQVPIKWLLDNEGNNALHYASRCYKNNEDVIELLVDANMMILNEKNQNGQTPLHLAYKEGNSRNVEMLLKKLKPEDAKIKDNEGNNALHYASRLEENNQDVIELLIYANMMILNEKNQNGQTPLHLACQIGNYRNVEMLLKKLKPEDAKTKDNEGNNALHYASRLKKNNQDMIELLVDVNMMFLNEKNQNGQTPLHLACKEGDRRNVEMLLKKFANFNIEDNEGSNALHYAAMSPSNKNVIEFLITKGFNINAENKQGYTPIHFATKVGNQKNVECLFQRGASKCKICQNNICK